MNCRQIMKRKSAHARSRAWMHNVGHRFVRDVAASVMRQIVEQFYGPVDEERWAQIRAECEPPE